MGGQDEKKRGEERELALVSGASSGIGRAVSRRLMELGYEVYGIGRDFGEWEAANRKTPGAAGTERMGTGIPQTEAWLYAGSVFHPIRCDLLDSERLPALLEPIRRTGRLRLLVNNAGAAYYGLHEMQTAAQIREMLRTNLETPMLLTQFFLRGIRERQGCIVNISSVTAMHSSPHAAVYAASKAGLLSFSRSLFEELRKHGVRVVSILPDLTETELYRNADFRPGASRRSICCRRRSPMPWHMPCPAVRDCWFRSWCFVRRKTGSSGEERKRALPPNEKCRHKDLLA